MNRRNIFCHVNQLSQKKQIFDFTSKSWVEVNNSLRLTAFCICNVFSDYCASKFAAVGFAESIGLELLAIGKDGVKTTIVCPYFINTGMFDGCQTK